MDEFLARALVAGAGLSLITGPLGCLVVWRRMAYFGDALAHSALLGVVLGLLLGTAPLAGVVAVAVASSLILAGAGPGRRLSSDTMLGIIAHGALALGLVGLSLFDRVRVDLLGWLFGDILAVSWADAGVVWAAAFGLLGLLARLWPGLVACAVDEDLARVEGRNVARLRLGLMLMLAVGVAAAMKVVGVMLVTALLVIPAAAARPFARSPEGMAVLAALAALLAVAGGLAASWVWDLPAGPAIVVAALALFVAGLPVRGRG